MLDNISKRSVKQVDRNKTLFQHLIPCFSESSVNFFTIYLSANQLLFIPFAVFTIMFESYVLASISLYACILCNLFFQSTNHRLKRSLRSLLLRLSNFLLIWKLRLPFMTPENYSKTIIIRSYH